MDEYLIDTPALRLTQMEFILRLLVACGIGFVIGLEREHTALQQKEEKFAGIRTFIFLSLLGFIGVALHYVLSPWVFAGVFLGAIVLISISYWVSASDGDIGGTAEITALLAILLGGLTFMGYLLMSVMITVIMVVLLSSKGKLQTIIGKITSEELYDFIRFVVVAALIFPLLPNETYGPYDVINPREIGWVILLTSGFGLIGYILMRIMGAGKGILLTGIMGGLVSSTVVTWVFSKKSKEHPELSPVYATAILAASSIMVIRVIIWVFIFNKSLLPGIATAIGLLFVAALGATLILFKKHNKKNKIDTDIPPGKPLNLSGALFFGILYTAILLIVAYANDMFGAKGIYISSGIAGLSDVDAITISVSKLAKDSIPLIAAQNAILIATLSNTLVKMCIALWGGSSKMRGPILFGYGFILAAGVIGFVLLNTVFSNII